MPEAGRLSSNSYSLPPADLTRYRSARRVRWLPAQAVARMTGHHQGFLQGSGRAIRGLTGADRRSDSPPGVDITPGALASSTALLAPQPLRTAVAVKTGRG